MSYTKINSYSVIADDPDIDDLLESKEFKAVLVSSKLIEHDDGTKTLLFDSKSDITQIIIEINKLDTSDDSKKRMIETLELVDKTNKIMKSYTMQIEYKDDLENLLKIKGFKDLLVEPPTIKTDEVGTNVYFKSTLALYQIDEYTRQVEDGHIMTRTLKRTLNDGEEEIDLEMEFEFDVDEPEVKTPEKPKSVEKEMPVEPEKSKGYVVRSTTIYYFNNMKEVQEQIGDQGKVLVGDIIYMGKDQSNPRDIYIVTDIGKDGGFELELLDRIDYTTKTGKKRKTSARILSDYVIEAFGINKYSTLPEKTFKTANYTEESIDKLKDRIKKEGITKILKNRTEAEKQYLTKYLLKTLKKQTNPE